MPQTLRRTALRWAWAVLLLALASGCAQLRLGNLDASVRVVGELSQPVALEPFPGMAVVAVTVNGRPGFRFLVDTGAAGTAIFVTDKSRALGLQATSDYVLRGAGSGPPVRAGIASGVALQIGPLNLSNLSVVLIPTAAMPVLGDERSFVLDGIIGYDLMSRYAVQVDTQAGVLRLHPSAQAPRSVADEVLALEMKGRQAYVRLPVRPPNAPRAVDAHVHLDTGASNELTVRADGKSEFSVPERAWATEGFGVQGAASSWTAPIGAIVLGGITFEGEPVEFQSRDIDESFGRDGRLGHRLLQLFDYTVDFPARQMILRTTPKTAAPRPTGLIGLRAVPYDGGYVVRGVTAESPAAASGFKAGDRLLRVAGHAVADLNWLEFARLFELESGASIEVCVDTVPVNCRQLVAVDLQQPPLVPANRIHGANN